VENALAKTCGILYCRDGAKSKVTVGTYTHQLIIYNKIKQVIDYDNIKKTDYTVHIEFRGAP
jgi:hypothetical protein